MQAVTEDSHGEETGKTPVTACFCCYRFRKCYVTGEFFSILFCIRLMKNSEKLIPRTAIP